MPMRFAPTLCELAAHVSGGFAQVVVRSSVGDGIETPQEIFAKAGESRVIRGGLVEEAERMIDGGAAVIGWGRMRGIGSAKSHEKTTEEEAHAGIIAKCTVHDAPIKNSRGANIKGSATDQDIDGELVIKTVVSGELPVAAWSQPAPSGFFDYAVARCSGCAQNDRVKRVPIWLVRIVLGPVEGGER